MYHQKKVFLVIIGLKVMARNLWSILCSKAIVEHGTGNISLIDVFDEVSLHHTRLNELESNLQPILSINMSIASLWEDDGADGLEELHYRVSITTPSDKSYKLPVQTLSLEPSARYRGLINLEGLPYGGEGKYLFSIELMEAISSENGEVVCKLPFTVKIVDKPNIEKKPNKAKKIPAPSKKKAKTSVKKKNK